MELVRRCQTVAVLLLLTGLFSYSEHVSGGNKNQLAC